MTKLNLLLTIIILNISSSILTEDKRFAIIIPSYKNASFYKKNLDSAINQNYDKNKFRIVYIADGAVYNDDPQTSELVEAYIKEKNISDLVTLRKIRVRRGAMANLWSEISLCDHDEIVVMLDGDDSLKDDNVLKYLNDVYQDPNVWLTYGQYECDPIEYGTGFAAAYNDDVIKNRSFRSNFLATHLRTYYSWLFQNIKFQDFIYDDSFLTMTWDLAIMFPALEMCGNKFKFISKILYKYNMNNPLSDFKTDESLMYFLAEYYKKEKPKYPKLDSPKYIDLKKRYKNPGAVCFAYCVDKYLSPGFDINSKDFKGRTPLMQAIKFGLSSIIDFLISKGSDINATDRDGLTPLTYATIFTNNSVVKQLIEHGANIKKVDTFGHNALWYAKQANKNDIIQTLESTIIKRR